MKIDGQRFLGYLGLKEEGLTAEDVCNALSSLTNAQLYILFAYSTVAEVHVPSLSLPTEEELRNVIEYIPTSYAETDVTLKRKIKYEKSYLAKKDMRRQLGPSCFEHGKHYFGKRNRGGK